MSAQTHSLPVRRLARYQFFIVLLLVLIAVVRPSWGVLALGAASATWPLRRLSCGRWNERTALDWAVLALAATVPVGLWMSADRALSLVEAGRLLLGVGLMYALVNSVAVGLPLWPAAALVIGGGAGLALLGLIGGVPPAGQVLPLPALPRLLPWPLDMHANVLATALAMSLPLAAAFALWQEPVGRPRWTRWAAAAATAVIPVGLLFTQSRGAFLGLAAAGLVMVVLRWRWLALPALGLAAAGALGLRLAGEPLVPLLTAGIPGREEVWLRGLAAVEDFPLTGIGLGLFGRLVPILYPFYTLGAGPAVQPNHAHNLYLQVATDLGLPGLVALIAVLLAAAALLGRSWRSGEAALRPLAWGLAGSLTAVAVHGLVDAVAWSSRVSVLLWLILGLVVALPQPSVQQVNVK
ncbi:MAG: O-antigen ligase family protein [Anaerolineae bacterium]|nr:O-antigen ligase family protein [Anaerolineae bacterium]